MRISEKGEIRMDDKNLASQLIDKMKKYIHGSSGEPERETELTSEAEAMPKANAADREKDKKPMRLPDDESLFEFESFEFESDVTSESASDGTGAMDAAAEVSEAGAVNDVTDVAGTTDFVDISDAEDEPCGTEQQAAEEAEVAAQEEALAFEEHTEDVSETSDISSDSVSVFFGVLAASAQSETVISEAADVADANDTANAADVTDAPEVSEASSETAELDEDGIAEPSESADEKDVTENVAQSEELDEKDPTDGLDEEVLEEISEEAEGSEETEEVEQETNEETDCESEQESPRFFNPFGVQEKFDISDLDESDGETPEKEPEMTVVSGLGSSDRTEDGAEEIEETDEDGADDDIDEFFDLDESGAGSVGSDVIDGLFDTDGVSASDTAEDGLTEVNDEPDEAMEYNNDVWDDDERASWTEEERFTDFCASLPLPKIKEDSEGSDKNAKQDTVGVKSSGYRYEMTERLPLFPDGLRGGKEQEGYIEREKAYCAEREKNRREMLDGKLKKSSLSMIFAAICLGVMLVYENIGVFFGGFAAKNVYLFAGIDILLVLLAAFIARNSILDGIRCAVKGIFIPETVTAGVIAFSVIYNVLLMICRPLPEDVMLLGIPSGIAVMLTVLYRRYLLKREIKVFDVASSYGSYSTEVRMYGFRNTPEGAAFDGYASPSSSLYRINRISRVDGVYNEQPQRDECYGIIRLLTLCILCAAVVCGVVFGLVGREVYSGILAAYTVIALASPVSVFAALLVPRYIAASEAASDGGAIIGFDEESDEFDDNVIMIDDSELYPPESLKIVKFDVCRSPMLEKHLARAAAMFKKTGGTLSGLFRNMEQNLSGQETVTVTEVSEHGLTATVDGNTVRAGSAAYMEKYGIEVEKYVGVLSADTRVLYISDNGEFFTRIVLSYSPNEALCRKIAGLRHADTLVSLKTCDPCIDKALVFCTTGLEPELLRVIKLEAGDDLAPAETDREGILVSNNGATGIISALLEYKRQKKLIFGGSRFAAIACIAGIALALLFTVFNVRTGIMSALMLAFHAVLSGIGVFIGTRGTINTKNKIKKK